jgi:hypothetical protein
MFEYIVKQINIKNSTTKEQTHNERYPPHLENILASAIDHSCSSGGSSGN